ncbi:MAG: T9SS type A sorting domain-containing protein [Bacteroidota bacterium]
MYYVFFLFLFVFCTLGSSAQTVHELPFASRNNVLEFAIENSATLSLEDVSVTATDVPPWLQVEPQSRTIGQISGGRIASARFSLSVEQSASVGQEHRISMTVRAASGMSWKKDLLISVAPPTSFELFQNYPNPFNPTTTIEYQLAAESAVQIRIYDLLGREIGLLVDGRQPAGSHRALWDAGRQSSGMYFYELLAEEAGGNQTVIRRAMMLLK